MAKLNDVARLAGVSTATVSAVINKSRYVSAELEELEQGAELGPQFGGPGIPGGRVKPVGEAWLVAGTTH